MQIMKETLFIRLVLGFTLFSFSVSGQNADFKRIEDNSFLMEEAYNQEPGVIQHISAFQYMENNSWWYSFTEEWPVPGQKHQLSTTIPVINSSQIGFGDVAMNYRYQAIFTDHLAFSPRFSLLLPTGNYRKGLGSGVLGYQMNLPVSLVLTNRIVSHYNLGATITPGAIAMDHSTSDIFNINFGASVIWLLSENLNLMLEAVGNTLFEKSNNAITERSKTIYLNPGLRYAINFRSGLQIVPGIALPIGIGASRGEVGLFAYLSFEHSFWTPNN